MTRITAILREDVYTFIMISLQILLRMANI